MTDKTRLTSLSPRFGDRNRRGRLSGRRGLRPGEVLLEIRGVAAYSSEMLAFIDRLFANPNFRDPDLTHEAIRDGHLEFALSTIYIPEAGAPADAEDPASEQEDSRAEDEETDGATEASPEEEPSGEEGRSS